MSHLNIYVTTFNCARTLVDVDFFSSTLLNGLKSDSPPEFIILALQEIAPLGQSFLGGYLLAPYFARLATAVSQAVSTRFGKGTSYNSVLNRNLGMTALMVFARPDVATKIEWLETAGVGCGVWDMGNKGAVGGRVGLRLDDGDEEETVLTFVAAHLAPSEKAFERRNQDWKSICENLVFEPEVSVASGSTRHVTDSTGADHEDQPLLKKRKTEANESGIFSSTSHLFFAGDLNYRTSDSPPAPLLASVSSSSPSSPSASPPTDDRHPEQWPQSGVDRSNPRHYHRLLPQDQLMRERAARRTLHLLDEAPIDFPPTYKYSDAAQKRARERGPINTTSNSPDSKQDAEDNVWLWAQHRAPSWCDRILFRTTSPSSPPQIHTYTALPLQPTSDHRPVVLSMTLSPRISSSVASRDRDGDEDDKVLPPFAIRKDWRQRRAIARRNEVCVGLAAYLGLTWEGRAIVVATILAIWGGTLALRAVLG